MNNNPITVQYKRLTATAKLPIYATDGSGCFDLFPDTRTLDTIGGKDALICGLGFAVAIPQDWVMEIYSRSGHGFKYNIVLANGTGIIDSDYRGEVKVALVADGYVSQFLYELANGDNAIAQAKLVYAPRVNFIEVAELDSTARGTGGFGSTDKINPEGVAQDGC